MTSCYRQSSGTVELYFYGELDAAARDDMAHHLSACAECRQVLEDLETIRAILAERPDIDAPPGRNWGPFMARLDEAVRSQRISNIDGRHEAVLTRGRSYVGYVAMAALIALVTMTVFFAWRTRERSVDGTYTSISSAGSTAANSSATTAREPAADAAFTALTDQHFERSKLVVLGLATKDPADVEGADWEYERGLAGTLLTDTRLYRLAAEERGLTSLARVMQDLELVLLQASMSEKPDASTLEQLQRLIRRRDLVTKMGLVTTTAGI
jgi:hypothetical protein